MATIQDVEALGYAVGLAHGSVQVEEDALAAAKEAADPNLVLEQANTVANDTFLALGKIDRLPETPEERLELFSQIGAHTLTTLTEAVTAKVAWLERSLAIAQDSPDVWCVQQLAGDALVLQTYVSTKPDGTGWDDAEQARLDALADQDGYAEREYQGLNPDAMQAAATLRRLGVSVTRPTPGADAFEVDGATYSSAKLVTFAEKRADEPPPPTTAEKVAAAVAAAPELSAPTKQALQAALEE